MDAIISGRAGIALLLDGASLLSFDVDDPATLLPRRQADIRFLFGEATDLQRIENVNQTLAAQALECAFNSASALDLTLILLDAELSDEVRAEAAAELENLLSDPQVVNYLENVMYARPLPPAADINGALARCATLRTPTLLATLQTLDARQPEIREVCQAWDGLPAQLFGSEEQKSEFQHAAVHEGLFRALATALTGTGNVGGILVKSLLNPAINALKSHREVLQQWTRPFLQHDSHREMKHEADEYSEQAARTRQGRREHRRRINREAVLENVQSQKSLVVEAMQRRDLDRARKIVAELVAYQQKTGEPIHVVRSLCDLATEAKALGMYSLQLELTEQGIDILPDDGWTWAQYGDALLKGQRLTDALSAFQQAESFGQFAVAKSGRAETLKALGQFKEALIIYDDLVVIYPENVVAKNGRAETLRALNRLPEALVAYDDAIADHPENVVAKNGRAETLRALNRLPEALVAYDDAIADHPENVVAKTGRAETLRALNRLPEALVAYNAVVNQHPEDVVAKNGRAETLRALNRLPEALVAYDDAIADHPENVVAKNGRAETLRALNRLPEALVAYNAVVNQHPEDVVAKTGRAETLRALNRLPEALVAYDDAIADHPENVVAKNGRAETLRALNRLPEALVAYNAVVNQHPEDVVAKNGRAETLRALNRLPEALIAYNAVVNQHPEDVVAKTGRAETLRALNRLPEALVAYDDAIADHPENVVAKNGRAETLRALNRLPEALVAYNAVVNQHPEDVVAKTGRAETLRALNRLPEALVAYDDAIADHPENVVAKNGRSCILAALHRYDEALQHLPSKNPRTLSEWIGYHIRGMILLRTDKVDEAIQIFEEGVRDDPMPTSKEYFRNALAIARLRRHDFIEASRILDEVTTPLLQPQANVLRLHSFGASGEFERATTAYDALADKPWSVPDELVAELHRKYILKEEPRHDDDWVFDQEVNTLLLVANQQAMIFSSMAA